MSTKWRFVTVVTVVLLLIILVTEGVLVPKQLQPGMLPIQLIGVEKTETGALATFEVRNESGTPVDVWPVVTLEVGPRIGFETHEVQIQPTTIHEQASTRIVVQVPAEEDWQLLLPVARHKSRTGTVVYSGWFSDIRH